MEITSAGINSDLIFVRFNGIIRDHGDFIEVRTPHNPEYYSGNFLIFPAAPIASDIANWQRLFQDVFKDEPRILHQAFDWPPESQITRDAARALANKNFEIDRCSVLAASGPILSKPAPNDVDFRPLKSDDDWDQATQSQIDNRDLSFDYKSFSEFKQVQMKNYRAMQNAGLGHWFGAFKSGELVANMGIFHAQGVSRFQAVVTNEPHRRQGICSAFVRHVSCQTQQQYPDNKLVILADENQPAERIYRKIGYTKIETLESAMLRPSISFAKPD